MGWIHTTASHSHPKLTWDHLAPVRLFPPCTTWFPTYCTSPARPLRLMFPNQAALRDQWKELSHCVISFKQMMMMMVGHVGLKGISWQNMITLTVKTSFRHQWVSSKEEGPVLVSHGTFWPENTWPVLMLPLKQNIRTVWQVLHVCVHITMSASSLHIASARTVHLHCFPFPFCLVVCVYLCFLHKI